MIRKYAAVLAALMVCAPIGGSADSALGSYVSHFQNLRSTGQCPPGALELVLLGSSLVVLFLIAPRLLSSLSLPKLG